MKGLTHDAQQRSLEELLPAHFHRTAHVIAPDMRVKIQATCQRYVDHSISSTVNLPEDIEPEVISRIYLQAWKHGLKGITVYRDGSRYPILSVDGKGTPFQESKNKRFRIRLPQTGEKDDVREVEVGGDEIVRLPNGRLTTVYHLLRRKEPHQDGASEAASTLVRPN